MYIYMGVLLIILSAGFSASFKLFLIMVGNGTIKRDVSQFTGGRGELASTPS